MDRFDSMTVLVAVIEAGSLSATSRKLNIPLATVSRKVAELEAHLRTRLVVRTSRRLELTDAGRAYVTACKQILMDLGEAERTASGEYSAPQGELTITASIVFGRLHVLPVTVEFLRAYPQVRVRIRLADRIVNLVEDHVDVAVRIGELPDSGLVAARIGAISRVVCGSPDYFSTRGKPGDPDELAAHDCISFIGISGEDRWTFGKGKMSRTVPINSRLIVDTAEAAIDAAVAGIGVTRVLCYQMVEHLRAGRLQIILREFEPDAAPVSLVHTGQPLLPLKVRAFMDFAAPRLRARLQAVAALLQEQSELR